MENAIHPTSHSKLLRCDLFNTKNPDTCYGSTGEYYGDRIMRQYIQFGPKVFVMSVIALIVILALIGTSTAER
jgi:hypothetical protein